MTRKLKKKISIDKSRNKKKRNNYYGVTHNNTISFESYVFPIHTFDVCKIYLFCLF